MSVIFTDSEKDEIWSIYHGKRQSGIDPFGIEITRDNCAFDHIYPKDKDFDGSGCIANGIPMDSDANGEKSNKLNGVYNSKRFKVIKSGWTCNKKIIGSLYINGVKVSKFKDKDGNWTKDL